MNTRTLETWIFRGNLTKIHFDNVTNTFNDFVLVSRGFTSFKLTILIRVTQMRGKQEKKHIAN